MSKRALVVIAVMAEHFRSGLKPGAVERVALKINGLAVCFPGRRETPSLVTSLDQVLGTSSGIQGNHLQTGVSRWGRDGFHHDDVALVQLRTSSDELRKPAIERDLTSQFLTRLDGEAVRPGILHRKRLFKNLPGTIGGDGKHQHRVAGSPRQRVAVQH